MEPEIGLHGGEVGHVGEEGRDADPARDQQMPARGPDDGKEIAGLGKRQLVPRPNGVVKEGRPAARVVGAAHGDLVPVRAFGRTDQRIGIPVHAAAGGDRDHDVASGGEPRQLPAVAGNQGEAAYPRRDHLGLGDADGESGRSGHAKASTSPGSAPGSSASACTPM